MTTRLHLTPADQGRPISLEEFLSADYEEGSRYEIIEGRLEVAPAADLPHDECSDWLYDRLRSYVLLRPDVINKVKKTPRVHLPEPDEASAPEPDLGAYHGYPLDMDPDEMDWRHYMPILVSEILSLETADKDLVRNRRLYLQVPGLREYWIVDTREGFRRPSLIVLRRRGRRWAPDILVPFNGTYETPLLPGFTLVVNPRA